jgi:hypothetical protein
MEANRYAVLVVEDEQEARQMVSGFSDDGKRIIKKAAEICRDINPGRMRCECFPCTMNRWMD